MSIDGEFKKGDFVLVKAGVEASDRGEIKFKGAVVGLVQEVEGEYAKVNVAFETQDITLTYRLADLYKY